MALTDQDIRLMASQVLADVPEGGGRMTGTEVVDNVSNNLFADVSELDRTIGRVSLRKAFPAVLAANRDAFYGVNAIIDQLPVDPSVSVTLFSTDNWTDTRTAAVSRMESYLARGPRYDGYLWDQHIAGQRAILLIQRTDREPPNVGATLVLVKNPGLSTEVSQFVRVTRVTTQERRFSASDCSGDFVRTVVTCEIGSALLYDFGGGVPNCNDDAAVSAADTRVFSSIVADAAKYAGMTTLAEPATTGALSVKAASIWGQLVPSAQVETALVDARPHGDAVVPIAAGAQASLTTTAAWSPTSRLHVGQGILPGTLTVTIGAVQVKDRAGLLEVGGAQVGTVDYGNGILSIVTGGPDYGTASKTITFLPAAQPVRAAQTAGWDITIESRSGTVVFLLDPVPGPGTLAIHYMAQGRWYVLRDDGSGALRGADSAYGSGVLNYNTGSVVVTLGALPDVDSTVIATWGARSTDTALPAATLQLQQTIQLTPPAGKQLRPGSLAITWTGADGQPKTATATGTTLSGDATGTVDYANNRVTFVPAVLPPVGTALTIGYGTGDQIEDAVASPGRDGQGRLNLMANQAIRPGSLSVEWPAAADLAVLATYDRLQLLSMGLALGDPQTYTARDDGNGNIRYGATTVGTVNYGTGAVQWLPDLAISIPKPRHASIKVGSRTPGLPGFFDYGSVYKQTFTGIDYIATAALYTTGAVKLRYTPDVAGGTASEVVAFAPHAALAPGMIGSAVAGSARLSLGTLTLTDVGGSLVATNPASGLTDPYAIIDYSSAQATFSNWPGGVNNSVGRQALLFVTGAALVDEVVFRTAGAPLRPGSLILQFRPGVGQPVVTVTSATNGLLDAANIQGTVDFRTGIVRVRFGSSVVAAGNETEPWFNPAAVRSNGRIFKPAAVPADTIRYAAVAYSYIPLDKTILGIDPVRLPSDGRVPIFRTGDVAVVHHTASASMTTAVPQTINLGRTRLSRVWLFDTGNNDARVATSKYTVNLDAGTVTLTDATGLVGPLRVEHRIEDMALVSDVQINGQLTFTKALTHDYPANSTGISSALVIGDLQARVTPPFDQQTWTWVWSDSLIGNATTAEYNSVQYPIVVDNIGAIQERWALIFTSSTSVRVVGESVGEIATLPIANPIAPLNPATGAPYFTIAEAGWGGGWSAGNVLRFNTVAANHPVWIARTVRQGPGIEGGDKFRLQIRGDAN